MCYEDHFLLFTRFLAGCAWTFFFFRRLQWMLCFFFFFFDEKNQLFSFCYSANFLRKSSKTPFRIARSSQKIVSNDVISYFRFSEKIVSDDVISHFPLFWENRLRRRHLAFSDFLRISSPTTLSRIFHLLRKSSQTTSSHIFWLSEKIVFNDVISHFPIFSENHLKRRRLRWFTVFSGNHLKRRHFAFSDYLRKSSSTTSFKTISRFSENSVLDDVV